LYTFTLLNAKNLELTSDRQFDKEGRRNFKEKVNEREEQLLRGLELIVFIKIKLVVVIIN